MKFSSGRSSKGYGSPQALLIEKRDWEATSQERVQVGLVTPFELQDAILNTSAS